jgi:hypothetical protein
MFLRLVDLSTTSASGGTVGTSGTSRVDNFSIYYYAILDDLPGDFNDDGAVDAADYVVWRKLNSGDMVAYNEWRTNFGRTSAGAGGEASGSGAVPEPASWLCVALGICLVAWRRGTLTAWKTKP